MKEEKNKSPYEIVSAKNPKWSNSEKTSIDLIVQFAGLKIPVEFTATKDDSEDHGSDLYRRALNGEFGKITEKGV